MSTLQILVALSGLTQRELAGKLGISDSEISRALRGSRRLTRERRARLATILVDRIVGEDSC